MRLPVVAMSDLNDSDRDAVLQELKELRAELRSLGESLSSAIGQVHNLLAGRPPPPPNPKPGNFFPALCLDVQNQCVLLVELEDNGEKRTKEIIHCGRLFDLFCHIIDLLQHRYDETHWAWYPIVFSGPQNTGEQMQRVFKKSCRELKEAVKDLEQTTRYSFLKGVQGGGGHGGHKILWDLKEKPSALCGLAGMWTRIQEYFTVPDDEEEPDGVQSGLHWVWRLLFATHCAEQAEKTDPDAWSTEIQKILEIDPNNYFVNVSVCRHAIEHWLDFWADLAEWKDVREAVSEEFKKGHRPLSEALDVKMVEDGHKWVIKDQGQTYTLVRQEKDDGSGASDFYNVYKINYEAVADSLQVEKAIAFVYQAADRYEQAEEKLRGLADKPKLDDAFKRALVKIAVRRDTLIDLKSKLPMPPEARDPQNILLEKFKEWTRVLCSSAEGLDQGDSDLLNEVIGLRNELAEARHLSPDNKEFIDSFRAFVTDCAYDQKTEPPKTTGLKDVKRSYRKWKDKQDGREYLTQDGNID